eukprot:SAG31_NODE_28505_length_409_cov_0.854839_1_plen_102_part_10
MESAAAFWTEEQGKAAAAAAFAAETIAKVDIQQAEAETSMHRVLNECASHLQSAFEAKPQGDGQVETEGEHHVAGQGGSVQESEDEESQEEARAKLEVAAAA